MATERLLAEDTTLGDALARVLEQAGIDTVIGLPGGDTMRMFDALYDYRDTIRVVTVREESLAGVMAEVQGRLTGKPGVVVAQGAFVIANALLGTLEAHLSSSPMILLTDLTDGMPFAHHGAYQTGAGAHGGFDAKGALQSVTKETIVADDPADAVQALQMGIRQSLSGDRGPVAILIHSRAYNKGRPAVGPDSRPALYATERYLPLPPAVPDAARLEAVVELLAAADRPVIIAGNGVRISQAFGELHAVARAFAAPVATSAGGKGVFPETDELGLGLCGTFGRPVANRLVAAADVVFVIGSRLAPGDTANEDPRLIDPGRQTIVQLDVDARNAGWTFPADHLLIGDARGTLAALLETSAARAAVEEEVLAARRAVVASQREASVAETYAAPRDEGGPMLAPHAVEVLSDALPPEAIVTCDAGENRLFMMYLYQAKQAGTYLQPAGVGAMGYAIPAALGAKLVHPNRPVVAVCGDGGFSMTMNGLLTAIEERLPIIVVVFNNASLGWVESLQRERNIASKLSEFDYSAVARAMGCCGRRVANPAELQEALDEALVTDLPTVIDVAIGAHEDHTYRALVSSMFKGPSPRTTAASGPAV